MHFYSFYSGNWAEYTDGGASNSWLYENLGNWDSPYSSRAYMTLTERTSMWLYYCPDEFWYVERWGLSSTQSEYYTDVGIRPVINVPTSSIVIED